MGGRLFLEGGQMQVKLKKDSSGKRAALSLSGLLFMATQMLPLAAMAQGAPDSSGSGNPPSGGSTPGSGSPGINLDFASTSATVSAHTDGNIQVGGAIDSAGRVTGGTNMAITQGMLLTPAQNAALWQSISSSGAGQRILVDAAGAAAGGVANINSSWASNIASLVVPTGLQVNTIGFNESSPLNIAGSGNVLGSVFALQNTAGQTAVMNIASNLNIGAGGLLSGYLPTTGLAGLNLSSLFGSQNMNLNIAGNFTNNGTVTVPGNLNISVGGDLVNATIASTTATMAAANINILSGSGNLYNSGLMRAMDSISIATQNPLTDLFIDNAKGGLIEALGNINLRQNDAFYDKADITTVGDGDWKANELHMYGKNMEIQAGTMDAWLYQTGCIVHTKVNGSIKLAQAILSGDPTWFATNGDVTVGTISSSGDIAIIADDGVNVNGSITTDSGGILLMSEAIDETGGTGTSGPSAGTFDINVNPGGNFGYIDIDNSTLTATSYIKVMQRGDNGSPQTWNNVNFDAGTTVEIATDQQINFTGTSSITAGGNITIVTAVPVVTANTQIRDGSITNTSGTILPGRISAPAAGNLDRAITLRDVSTTGGNIVISNGNGTAAITVNGFLTATGDINVTNPGTGDIVVNGVNSSNGDVNLNAGSGNVTVTNSTSILGNNGTFTVTGSVVSLTASNGNIGASGNFIQTNANTLGISAGGTGNVFINEASGIGVNGFNIPGTLSLSTTSGGITFNANGTADGFTVTANGANNDITLGNNVTLTGTAADSVFRAADDIIYTNPNAFIDGTGRTVTLSGASANQTIGINGGAGTLALASGVITNTRATNLQIGESGSGAITMTGFDFSGNNFSELRFTSGSTFTHSTNSNLGGDTMRVTAVGITINNDISGTNQADVFLTATGAGTISVPGKINFASGGSSTATLTSASGSITASGDIIANSVAASSTSGAIDIDTQTASLTASTSNSIQADNTNVALNLGATASSNNTVLITNDRSITVTDNVSGKTGVTITTTGSGGGKGDFAVNTGKLVSSSNANVTIEAETFALVGTGSLSASGTATIRPANAGVSIGVNGAGGTLNIDATELSQIAAGTLVIGATNRTGDLSLSNALDVTSLYNLQLLNQGTVTMNAGSSLTLGSKDFTATGNGVTLRAISGGANSDVVANTVTSGAISTLGNISLGNTSSLTLAALGNNNDVTQANGTTYTATTITMSTNGTGTDILDAGGNSVDTTTSNLNVATNGGGGAVNVANSGAGALLFNAAGGTIGGNLTLSNSNGTITVGSTLDTSVGGTAGITVSGTGGVTFNRNMSTDGATISTADTLAAGAVTVANGRSLSSTNDDISITSSGISLGGGGAVFNIDTGGTTAKVTLIPNSDVSIGVGAGSEPYQITAGSLAEIQAGTVQIGSAAITQGIVVTGDVFGAGTSASNLTFLNAGGFDATGATLDMATKSLTVNVGGAIVTGAVTSTGAGGTYTYTGTSINVSGGVGSTGGNRPTTVNMTASSGDISGTGAVRGQSVLLSASGDIGTGTGTRLTTEATTQLQTNAGAAGNVFISNSGGNLTNFNATTTTGTIDIVHTGGNLTLGGNVIGKAGVSFDVAGTLDVTGRTVSTNGSNNAIDLTVRNLTTGGTATINAGSGQVTIVSQNNQTIGIGGAAGTLQIDDNELDDITAGTVQIGNGTNTAGITVNSYAAGYNLNFQQGAGGGFTLPDTNTLAMGANNLTINVGGAAAIDVVTGGTTISITGSSVALNDNIGTSGTTTTTNVTATGGNITQTGAVILQGTTTTLLASAAVGATGGSNPIETNASTLNVTANGGGAFVINSKSVSLSTASATGDFFLQTTGASSITVPGAKNIVVGNNATVTLQANDLILNGTVNVGGSTNVTTRLMQNANGADIGFGTAGGTYGISQAEMLRITSATLQVGDSAFGGGVTYDGTYAMPGSGAGNYNVTVNNGGGFTSVNGSELDMNGLAFNATVAGSIAVNGKILNASTLTLDNSASGSTPTITQGVNGVISGVNVFIRADNGFTQTNGAAAIAASTALTLNSDTGNIESSTGSDVLTNTPSLTINKNTGTARISNTTATKLSLQTSNLNAGTLILTSDQTVSVAGDVTADGGISITTTSGNLTRTGVNNELISTGTVTLDVAGNIGVDGTSSANRFETNAGKLAAKAGGSAFLEDLGAAALTLTGTNQAAGTYDLSSSGGNLNLSSSPTAGTGSLLITQASGNIVLSNSITFASANQDVTVNASAGNVQTGGNSITVHAGRTATLGAIDTTNAGAQAGAVTVIGAKTDATGAVTVGNITANSTAAGVVTGAVVSISQLLGSSGNLQVGTVNTSASGNGSNAGNVGVSQSAASTGSVSVGAVNTSASGNGGDAGSISINGRTSAAVTVTGSLNSSGTANGATADNIQVRNFGNGTNGGVTLSTALTVLNSSATNGGAGSITVEALGAGDGVVTLTGLTSAGADVNASATGSAGGGVTIRGKSFSLPGANNVLIDNSGTGANTDGVVTLETTSTTADITFGTGNGEFNITNGLDGGTVNITAGQSILDPTNTALVSQNVNLTATKGHVGASTLQRFNVTGSTNLNVSATNTGSDAFLQTGAITLSGAGFNVNDVFDLQASGLIQVSGNVSGSTTINLTTTGGNDISDTGGFVQATNVNLNSSRDILNTFDTKATNLTVVATGNADVRQTGAVNLGTSSAGGSFTFQSNADVTLNSGAAVAVQSGTGSLSLTITGNLNNSSGAATTLRSTGASSDVSVTINGAGNKVATVGANDFVVNSGRDITISAAGGIDGQSGANVSLTAARNISAPAIDTSSAAGSAKTISLISTGGSGTITAGALTANGGGAAGNGGKVLIQTDSTGTLNLSGFTVSATGSGSGSGGKLFVLNGGKALSTNGGIDLTGLNATLTGGATGGGGVIDVSAVGNGDGNIDFGGLTNQLNVSAGGGDGAGGTLSLVGAGFTGVGAGVDLRANSSGIGALGSVTLQTTKGGATGDITLGTAAGAFNLSAVAAKSNWTVNAGRNVNVSAAQSTSGTIAITSAGTTSITGDLTTSNAGASAVSINATGGMSTSGTATVTTGAAGRTTLTAGAGNDIGSSGTHFRVSTGTVLLSTSGATGDAYIDSVSGSAVTMDIAALGAGSTPVGHDLTFHSTAGGTINLADTTIASANNGAVDIQVLGAAGDIDSVGNTAIDTSQLVTGSGGAITLQTVNGKIDLGNGALTSSGKGAGLANAGKVTVVAGTGGAISTGAITADAVVGGTANGITVTSNGGSNILVQGGISANSTGGAGVGGKIEVTANGGGQIQVNGNVSNTGPGSSGEIIITETNGTKLAFNTGGTGANKISGTLSGGDITINNFGGDVDFAGNAANAIVQSTKITVQAGLGGTAGSITGVAANGNLVSTGKIDLTAINGGSIGAAGAAIKVSTGAGQIVRLTTSGAGDVTVADLSSNNVILHVPTLGDSLSYVKTAGDIQLGTAITSASTNGTVSLQINGVGNITNPSNLTITSTNGSAILSTSNAAGAGNSVGTSGNPILTTVANIQANAGGGTLANSNIFITETNGAAINGNSKAGGSIALVNKAGTLTVNNGVLVQSANGQNIDIVALNGATQINGAVNAAGALNLNNGAAGTNPLTLGFGATANVDAGSTISMTTNSGNMTLNIVGGATIDSGGTTTINPNGKLDVQMSGGGTATLTAGGAGTTIAPAGGQTLDFLNAASATTLQINGGAVAVNTSAKTTVGTNVTIASNNDQTWTVNGGNSLFVNGVIDDQKVGANLTIRSTAGDLTLTNSAGTGQINTTGNSGANKINVTSNGNLTLGGAITFQTRNAAVSTVVGFAGNTTTGSNTVNGIASTAGLAIGQELYGPGIVVGTTITGVAANSITMSQNAYNTAAGAALTGGKAQVNFSAANGSMLTVNAGTNHAVGNDAAVNYTANTMTFLGGTIGASGTVNGSAVNLASYGGNDLLIQGASSIQGTVNQATALGVVNIITPGSGNKVVFHNTDNPPGGTPSAAGADFVFRANAPNLVIGDPANDKPIIEVNVDVQGSGNVFTPAGVVVDGTLTTGKAYNVTAKQLIITGTIVGTSVTIANTPGFDLEIVSPGTGGKVGTIRALTGPITINSSNGFNIVSSVPGTGTTLVLDSRSGAPVDISYGAFVGAVKPTISSDVTLQVTNVSTNPPTPTNLNVTITNANGVWNNQGAVQVTGNTNINFTGGGTSAFTNAGTLTGNINTTLFNTSGGTTIAPLSAGAATTTVTSNGAMQLNAGGTVQVLTKGGANAISFESTGGNLTLSQDRQYLAGNGGSTTFKSNTAVVLNNGVDVSSGALPGGPFDTSSFNFTAPTLTFTSNNIVRTDGQINMTATTVDLGANQTIQTGKAAGNGIVVSATANNHLTLNLNGTNTKFITGGADVAIANTNNGKNLTVNGTVANTVLSANTGAAGGKLDLSVNDGNFDNNTVISASKALVVEGNAGINGAGAAADLTFTNSGRYFAGTGNLVTFRGDDLSISGAKTLTTTDLAGTNGSNLTISSKTLSVFNGTQVNVGSGTFTMDSNGNGANGMQVNTKGTATFNILNVNAGGATGAYNFVPGANGGVFFNDVGGAATLNLNNGNVTMTSNNGTANGAGANQHGVTIDPGMTLASDRDMTFNVNASTFRNGGVIQSAGSNLQVNSTGSMTVDGTGQISNVGGGAGNQLAVSFTTGAAGTMTFINGASQTVTTNHNTNANRLLINTNNIVVDGSTGTFATNGGQEINFVNTDNIVFSGINGATQFNANTGGLANVQVNKGAADKTFTVSGNLVFASDSNTLITGTDVDLTAGKLDIGGGGSTKTLSLIPSAGAGSVAVGNTAAAGFAVNDNELGRIRAGVVNLGNTALDGSVTLSDITLGAGAAGQFDQYTLNLISGKTGGGAVGFVYSSGTLAGNDVSLNAPNSSIGTNVNFLQTDVQVLRFNASTSTNINNTGGLLTVADFGGSGFSKTGVTLNLTAANGMQTKAGTTIQFTGASATAKLDPGTGGIGTAGQEFRMTSGTAAFLTFNPGGVIGATVNGLVNLQSAGGIVSSGNLVSNNDMTLHTPSINNGNTIAAGGGNTLTITNRDGSGALSLGAGLTIVNNSGKLDAGLVFFESPNGNIAVTQQAIAAGNPVNNLVNGGHVIAGNAAGNFTMSILGNQIYANLGNAANKLQSGGTMSLTFAGPAAANVVGVANPMTLNLGNTLTSNGNMGITVTNGDLTIPFAASAKIDSGSANNRVTLTANNGSVRVDLVSLVGALAGLANGAKFRTTAFNDTVVSTYFNTVSNFDTTHADYVARVRNSNLGVNGSLTSTNGNVVLSAVDPANPTGMNAGDVIGATQGGSILVADGSSIQSAFNLQMIATQNVIIGNVTAFDQFANPTAPVGGSPGDGLNPVTTGSSAGVSLRAGAFNPAYSASLGVINMSVGSTWTDPDASSPFSSIGQILIDNRNPNNPGAMLPGAAQQGTAKAAGAVVLAGNSGTDILAGGQGAYEMFGSNGRQIVMGDNVSMVAYGGTADLVNDRNSTNNLGTLTGGVLVRGANVVSSGQNLTVGSFGGNAIIDAANGVNLSSVNPGKPNTPVSAGKVATNGVVTPSANGNWIFSVGALVPELMNPTAKAGVFTPAASKTSINITTTNSGIFPMQMYSGGGVGIYAGVPEGVYPSVDTTPGPLVDIPQQLFIAIQNRDDFPRLDVYNPAPPNSSGFTTASNNLAGSNGSLTVVMVEQAPQASLSPGKFTNGITFNPDGGVIILDPPPNGSFVFLGGNTLLQANAPAIPLPANFVPPPGTTLVNGVVVSVSLANFAQLNGAVVATDSTRSVTLSLSQSAQTMLDQSKVKKEAEAGTNAYYIAGGACQPFFLEEDNDTMMVGEKGTAFKTEKRDVTLQQGKIVAMVGKNPIKVNTGFGDVSVAGNSSAIIQRTESGVTRVANLSGKQTQITINRNGKTQVLTAEAGEEICLADESLSEEELIPVDGVDREQVIKGSIVIPGVKIAKSKFDQRMMVEKEKLLVCNAGSFYQAKNKINSLKNKIEKEAKPLRPTGDAPKPLQKTMLDLPELNSALSGDEDALMKPIAFSESTGASGKLRTFTTHSALVKHDGNASIGFDHPTIMQLRDGELLISADKTTVVKTPHSTVTINPNTIALISVGDKVTKVRNLFEQGHRQIRQVVGGAYVDIAAGEESILGWDQSGVNRALSKETIGRRKVRGIEVPGSGMFMQRAELALPALMQQENSFLLSDLVNSENPADKHLSEKMVKMAAVLQQVTAKHGQYMMTQPGPQKK